MKPSFGVEIIGWISSAILLCTIGRQIWKQWQEKSSEGVSVVLFVGQMAASLGFTIYSYLVGNGVFVVTNALMLLNGLIGLGITIHHRKRQNFEE
jgi:MtN3 and saliva related transmembrane protein